MTSTTSASSASHATTAPRRARPKPRSCITMTISASWTSHASSERREVEAPQARHDAARRPHHEVGQRLQEFGQRVAVGCAHPLHVEAQQQRDDEQPESGLDRGRSARWRASRSVQSLPSSSPSSRERSAAARTARTIASLTRSASIDSERALGGAALGGDARAQRRGRLARAGARRRRAGEGLHGEPARRARASSPARAPRARSASMK